MKATLAATGLVALGLGVFVLAITPGAERLPAGGRAIGILGVALGWGFVAVGSYARLRRPDNRTGALMTLVGLTTLLTGLQLADAPLVFALGALTDTLILAVFVHLMVAFPSGRVQGRWSRLVVALAYTAGALQLPALMFGRSECDPGVRCPRACCSSPTAARS